MHFTDAQSIAGLPKVELHVHLEGCMTARTLELLAARHGLSVPPSILSQRSLHFTSFAEFVRLYHYMCDAILTEEDFRLLIDDLYKHIMQSNIIHCEVSWTPFRYLQRDMNFSKIMDVMNEELAIRGVSDRVSFIIDTQRDHGLHAADVVYSLALDNKNSNIVGIGLTGIEEGFDPAMFSKWYKRAKESGLGLTAHTGEYGSTKDIWRCIRTLGVDRIGHGVQSRNDDTLISYIASEGIHVESCPTSNVLLGRVLSLSDHPIRLFRDRGIRFSINSDDPAIFAVSLDDEYNNAIRSMGLNVSDLRQTVLDTIEAAFITPKHRTFLESRIVTTWP